MHLPTIYVYCLSLRLLWTISTLLLNSFSIKGEFNIKDQMSQLAQYCITVRLDGMTWTHLLHYGYHLMNVRIYTFCGAYYSSFSRVLVHSQKWWVLCSFEYLRWRRRDVCNFHMIYIDDISHNCMCHFLNLKMIYWIKLN